MIKRAFLVFSAVLFSTGASAAVVALYGDNNNSDIALFLERNGHTVVYQAESPPNESTLMGVDAVIALRKDGNDAVKNFVLGGGLLITEWLSAAWALNTAQLLDATAGSSVNRGGNSTVYQTDKALELGLGGRGVGAQYADDDRTQFMYDITGIGASVNVLGTISDGTMVVVGGAAGAGYVIANGMDWGDNFRSGNHITGQWLLNALTIDRSVPPGPASVSEPALPVLLGIGLMAIWGSAARRRKRAIKH